MIVDLTSDNSGEDEDDDDSEDDSEEEDDEIKENILEKLYSENLSSPLKAKVVKIDKKGRVTLTIKPATTATPTATITAAVVSDKDKEFEDIYFTDFERALLGKLLQVFGHENITALTAALGNIIIVVFNY